MPLTAGIQRLLFASEVVVVFGSHVVFEKFVYLIVTFFGKAIGHLGDMRIVGVGLVECYRGKHVHVGAGIAVLFAIEAFCYSFYAEDSDYRGEVFVDF